DDLEGWCSIAGHRAMGMTLRVEALGGAAGAGTTAAGADPLARIPLDLQQSPGTDHVRRNALLPASAGPSQRLTLEVQDVAAEIAPGLVMDAMTYQGTVVGPVLRSELGA